VKLTIRTSVRLASTFAIAGSIAVAGLTSVASASTKHKAKAKPKPVAMFTVEKPAPANLSETGSTLLYPLWNLWAPDYQAAHPKVTVSTAGTGSGTGIADAASGTVNIGSSDAYLSPTTLASSPNLLNIPLAISYQVIMYNIPGVTAHLKLNGTVLSKIYLGKITNWNAPAITALNHGVKIPSLPIVALHRSDGSGDTFLFSQYLARQDGSEWGSTNYGTTVTWPAIKNSLAEQGNGGMVSGCSATPGCVAYVGVSFLTQGLGDGLGYAQLKNGTGRYVMPTTKAVAAEATGYTKITPGNGTISMINGRVKNGYPIINYEYAIVDKQQSSPATAQAVRSLLEWAISPKFGNRNQYLSQVRFLPLPTRVAVQSFKQIHKIK
jgi:phosphate transport system substrate-binding protein